MPQKNSLGRGLGALLPDILKDIQNVSPYLIVGVEELTPNRFQPRQDFNAEEQQKLISSIKKNGILQPIVVRKTEQGYEIIAGERRWRAAQAAGIHEVPIIIRQAEDLDIAELSLIENILRQSLGPLEEAQAYQTLTNRFGLSQEDVAERVGKDRSTIANMMRLLRLPEPVKKALTDKKITAGHARAMLSIDSPNSQIEVLRAVVKKSLSVRDTELLISKQGARKTDKKVQDPFMADLEIEISRALLVPVSIKQGRGSGTISIKFTSTDELNRLISLILSGSEH